MKTLQAGILGAGGMGRQHGLNLCAIEGVTVAAVCDSHQGRAEELARELGAAAYTGFEQMLAQEKLDVLYILVPPFAQTGQFEQAAERGLHIFIEKPIALTSRRGRSMTEAAQRAGVKTHVGFHMRYGSAVRRLRRLMDEGKTGRPVLFNGRYLCNSLHNQWWVDAACSGGQIFEQVIHLYDLCRHLMGQPAAVSALMGNVCHAHLPQYTVEDVSAAICSFPSGAKAAITATNCAVPGRWDAFVDVSFEHVTARFESPDEATFLHITPQGVTEERWSEQVDHKLEEDKAFIEVIRSGLPSVCPVEEGLRSLCFVEAALFSAKLDGEKQRVEAY